MTHSIQTTRNHNYPQNQIDHTILTAQLEPINWTITKKTVHSLGNKKKMGSFYSPSAKKKKGHDFYGQHGRLKQQASQPQTPHKKTQLQP